MHTIEVTQRVQVENVCLLLFNALWVNFLLAFSETLFYAIWPIQHKIYQDSSKWMFNLRRV